MCLFSTSLHCFCLPNVKFHIAVNSCRFSSISTTQQCCSKTTYSSSIFILSDWSPLVKNHRRYVAPLSYLTLSPTLTSSSWPLLRLFQGCKWFFNRLVLSTFQMFRLAQYYTNKFCISISYFLTFSKSICLVFLSSYYILKLAIPPPHPTFFKRSCCF